MSRRARGTPIIMKLGIIDTVLPQSDQIRAILSIRQAKSATCRSLSHYSLFLSAFTLVLNRGLGYKSCMRILVVEDNKAVSLIICRIIEEMGHDYVLASDGEVALRLFQQRDIDMLVADVELPVLDGFIVAREVRNQSPAIPILFISGNSSDAYRQQCLDAGGDMLLPKPLKPSELRRWLQGMMPDSPHASSALA